MLYSDRPRGPVGQHVFVSYSRRDSDVADELLAELARAGVKYWVDRDGIEGGRRWGTEIYFAIGEASAFIVLLSPASVRSEHVKDEVHEARRKGLPIVPVLIEEVRLRGSLQLWLGRLQLEDASQSPRTEAFRDLARRLRRDAGIDAAPLEAGPGAVDLQPYSECPHQRIPDLATASDDEVMSVLERIVAAEGPILGREAYARLLQFSGDGRLTAATKKRLNRLLHALLREVRVSVVPDSVEGVIDRTYYPLGGTPVSARELGPRAVSAVPPSELLALLEGLGMAVDSPGVVDALSARFGSGTSPDQVRKALAALETYRTT